VHEDGRKPRIDGEFAWRERNKGLEKSVCEGVITKNEEGVALAAKPHVERTKRRGAEEGKLTVLNLKNYSINGKEIHTHRMGSKRIKRAISKHEPLKETPAVREKTVGVMEKHA